MPLSEVVLKIKHDCPFNNISGRFPTLKIFVWCNREHEVIEAVVSDTKEYRAVVKALSKIGAKVKSSDRRKIHLITKCFCTKENSVTKNIDEFDFLHVLPIIHEQGWEYHRLIVFKHADLENLMRKLEEKGFNVEIAHKVQFNGLIANSLTLTADALFSDLTEKQMDAVLKSYRNGYYEIPRRSTLKALTKKEKVSRTTFEEHLRKAENKIVSSLVPYMQLFKQTSRKNK